MRWLCERIMPMNRNVKISLLGALRVWLTTEGVASHFTAFVIFSSWTVSSCYYVKVHLVSLGT